MHVPLCSTLALHQIPTPSMHPQRKLRRKSAHARSRRHTSIYATWLKNSYSTGSTATPFFSVLTSPADCFTIVLTPPADCPAAQRLRVENLEQQELIRQLMRRVQRLEDVMAEEQQRQRQRGSGGLWGGFFAPRGL